MKNKDDNKNTKLFKSENKTIEHLLSNVKTYEDKEFVDDLYKESKRWSKKLTKKQKHAIRKYTKNSLDNRRVPMKERFYYQLNSFTEGDYRSLTKPKELYEKYIKEISEAINKFQINESFVTFRGSDDEEFIGEVGDVIKKKRFLSSSIDPDKAFNKKYKIVIITKPNVRCAFLGKLSRIPRQKEVLFDINTEFKIMKKEENTTYVRILK